MVHPMPGLHNALPSSAGWTVAASAAIAAMDDEMASTVVLMHTFIFSLSFPRPHNLQLTTLNLQLTTLNFKL
jgi:hypothetical protein